MTQGVQTVLCDNLEGVGWDGRWEGGSTGMGQYIYNKLVKNIFKFRNLGH